MRAVCHFKGGGVTLLKLSCFSAAVLRSVHIANCSYYGDILLLRRRVRPAVCTFCVLFFWINAEIRASIYVLAAVLSEWGKFNTFLPCPKIKNIYKKKIQSATSFWDKVCDPV